MEGYGSSSYGDGFADVYDAWYRDVTDTTACVDRLASLAPAGAPVLELGVGTGRLALPLAAVGGAVTGVDSSAVMLAELAGKAGADQLHLVEGDMADLGATVPPLADEPTFALAFAAYNTLFNLIEPGAIARCLGHVSRRLLPGGRLVVEAFVPPGDRDGRRDSVAVSRMSATELVLTATLHDPDAQTISGQHVQISEDGVRLRPWMVHYRHPAELDALAAAVGLQLEDRWADWEGGPFDEQSPTHVSVYRRPA